MKLSFNFFYIKQLLLQQSNENVNNQQNFFESELVSFSLTRNTLDLLGRVIQFMLLYYYSQLFRRMLAPIPLKFFFL